MLDQQAYTLTSTDVFALSAALFLLLIGLVWLTKPARAPAAGGGAH